MNGRNGMNDTSFAHRAGVVGHLGNTMDPILHCLQTGTNFEIDVRECGDALVVTHHTKAGGDSISAYSLEELRRCYGIDPAGQIIHAPNDVHGGNLDRIPALAQVLVLLPNYPEIRVILDIKDSDIEEKVLSEVKKFGVESQVIYGAHSVEETETVKKINKNIKTLLFGKEDNFETDIQEESVDIIRIWQSWMESDTGEITDELVKRANKAGNEIVIMTGAPNEAKGGVVTMQQLRKLETMKIDFVILNDVSLCLQL